MSSLTPDHADGPRDGHSGPRHPDDDLPAAGWIVAYCDGGSRGNPGPAGFGVYIQDGAGKVLAEESEYLGARTNNFAEYSALLAAIEFAIAHGHRRLRVISDSELIVKQMKGQYRVNSPELRPLHEQARHRILALEKFEIRHVLREKNRHADRLANLAMDRGTGKEDRGTGKEDRGTRKEDRGTGKEDRGTGKEDRGTGKEDRGTGKASAVARPQPEPVERAPREAPAPPPAPAMLRGLVKGGVVRLLAGDLPDGTFVKVIPE